MGRIAEALRRAEQDRRFAQGPLGDMGEGPTLPAEPVARTTTPDEVPARADEGPNRPPVTLAPGLSESLVPYYERSSFIAEQYRALRTRLLSQNPHYEHRTVAITSAIPKEGKSVTTLNLGCILAEIRHLKVLVVDGDFRWGSLAHMLNQTEGPGLADVLGGEANYHEVIRDTPIPNLMFISAGNTGKRSAAQLLTSSNAKSVFQRMQTEFHYTLVDTPPATTVSDVGIIGQMCSGVIIVVRLHRTDEGAAQRAVRLLQANSISVTGCLLIGRDVPGDRHGGDSGCGHRYYRYYDYYRRAADHS